MSGIPPMSREMAAVYARQEMAAYAFIRAWMADDVDKGMLLIEQHNIPKESVIFVLSLVKAARRALLSATGYRGASRAHLGAGHPVPGQLGNLVEAERPVRFGMDGQDEGDNAVVGGAFAAGGGASCAGGVAKRGGSGLAWRPGPELPGRDAGQPGGLVDQGRISAAQLRTDHAQRPALRAAEDGVHVVIRALGEPPRDQLGHELAAGRVGSGKVLAVDRFRHDLTPVWC